MKLKTVVTFLYLLISVPIFLFFETEPIIWLSFFANYFLLTVITNYHLNFEKNYSPFLTSFIVFYFLFFLIAPIIQVNTIADNGDLFPTSYPYNVGNILFTNFLIFIFSFIFFISYVLLKKRIVKPRVKAETTSKPYTTPLFILTLLIFCLLVGVLNYDFLIDEIERSTYSKSLESVSSMLIRKKVLFLVPLGAIAIAYNYLKSRKKLTYNVLIIFGILLLFVLFLLVFKNPFTEKRNALGPIYITLIFIFYRKMINSNAKFFLFMFVSMVIFFPLISALTHLDATFDELIANPKLVIGSFVKSGGITDAFLTLHYDAFANIMATVDYVQHYGFSYGYQFLSAFLFFVPRSIWPSKPLSTGELIGDYLIDDYGFRYSNLSNPIVSEAFINYGIIGVIIMAIVSAYIMLKFTNWLNSDDYLKKVIAFYFAVHLMFLLRGDFTNGFSYFVGTFIGVFLLPKLIERTIRFLIIKRTN